MCQLQWTHTEVSYIRLVEAAVTTPCRVKLTRADKTAEAYIVIRKLVVGITRVSSSRHPVKASGPLLVD